MPKKRTASSRKWLKRQHSDVYTKKAKEDGFRSRAVYKLEEIQQKYRLIKPKMAIVELGAAPGGWTQYVRKVSGTDCKVLALDILPMEPIKGVDFICGDFTDDSTLDLLVEHLDGMQVDLVISDMAPNMSGIRAVDQTRAVYLVELALDFARQVLAEGGGFLAKAFHGEGTDALMRELKNDFGSLHVVKPKASRSESSEIYLLALNFKQKRN